MPPLSEGVGGRIYFGGLHLRLNSLYECDCEDCKIQLSANGKKTQFQSVFNAVEKAFKRLYEKGSYQPSDLLKVSEFRDVIDETAHVFSSAIPHEIPTEMKAYLEKDAFIFSGLKTHAQLTEARSLLKDKDGNIRPYHQFEKDILKLNEKYNRNYLQAEHQFAISSSQSAANWAKIDQTGRYYLQYRTANDDRVRDNHRVLHDITLPQDDPFWLSYYPPNGWRCRCRAVEVLKSKYEVSDSQKAQELGEKATTQIDKNGKNKLEIFRFNPGAEQKLFPPKHPYNKVKGAEEVKKALEKEVKETQYKNTSMKELEAMYESQKINLENENIIMNNGYVATANSFAINKKLRLDKPLSDNDKKIVNALDSLIKENKLPDNFLLYRNVKYDFIEATFGIKPSANIQETIDNIKNTGIKSYADKGFTSVSAIKDENVFKGRPAHLEIRTKKGTNAFITSNYDESEIILGRNQKMKILNVTEEKGKLKLVLETDN